MKRINITDFLTNHEIWFKTVLSLAVTVAALFVSIASCNNSRSQARLDATTAARESREKNPFFSVEQFYDKEREQYIYGIVNTGGQIRQCHVSIDPYLVIRQYEHKSQIGIISPLDSVSPTQYHNTAFIYLPQFYVSEDKTLFENCVFAFSDIWMDETVSRDFPGVNTFSDFESDVAVLADSYFERYTACYNSDENKTFMRSDIQYYVIIDFYNYENISQRETLWLRRGVDADSIAVGATGNQVLYYGKNPDIQAEYNAAKDNNCSYGIDTMNLTLNEIANEFKSILADLFTKFDQALPEHGRPIED